MFSFSEKDSIRPIAQVIGGDLDGKLLYLHRANKEKLARKGYFDEISLPSISKFEYFPDTRENFCDVITLSGSRGVGKSTKASEIALKIKKVFDLQDDDVIVAKKSEIDDPAFKKLNPLYLYINADILEEGFPTPDELTDGGRNPKILILDDLDTLQSSKLSKAFIEWQDSLVQEGRKYGITVISCNHRLCANKATKALLTESTYFLFFPAGLTSDFKYCLTRYGDMSLDVIRQLKKEDAPWVLFHQNSPKFILTNKQCKIFDLDREDEIAKDLKDKKKEQRLLKRKVGNF